MRSSFRVFDSKSGEMIGKVVRTGEEEISKLSFSHNEVVELRGEIPQTAGNYRVECWVGDRRLPAITELSAGLVKKAVSSKLFL